MDRFEELMEQIRINLNDDKRFAKKLMWIRDKVEHYSSVFGFSKVEILEAFEKKRTYWSANYYQESNFPVLDDKVKIFETTEDLEIYQNHAEHEKVKQFVKEVRSERACVDFKI
jgi:hypothetical protein